MASLDLASLVVSIKADVGDAVSKINQVENKLDDLNTTTQNSAKQMANSWTEINSQMQVMATLYEKIGKPLTKFLADAVDGASDLAETVSKTQQIFGSSSDAIMEWSETALDSMGMAQESALTMASTFGDLATSIGLPVASAKDMSMNLTQLAADLASFKNIDVQQAAQALQGVFTGNAQSLKNLGIVMNEATLSAYALSQGITTNLSAMSEAEKVQLRYQYVLQATANAQGDFQRTSSGFANASRKLSEGWDELKTSLGDVLLPIVEAATNALAGIVQFLNSIPDSVKTVATAILVATAAFTALVPVLKIATGALAAFQDVASGGITIAIAAVTAAVAGIAVLISKLKSVAGTADDTKTAVKKMLNDLDGEKATATVDVEVDTTDAETKVSTLMTTVSNIKDEINALKTRDDINIKGFLVDIEYGDGKGHVISGAEVAKELDAIMAPAYAVLTKDDNGDWLSITDSDYSTVQEALSNAIGYIEALGIELTDDDLKPLYEKLVQIHDDIQAQLSGTVTVDTSEYDEFKANLEDYFNLDPTSAISAFLAIKATINGKENSVLTAIQEATGAMNTWKDNANAVKSVYDGMIDSILADYDAALLLEQAEVAQLVYEGKITPEAGKAQYEAIQNRGQLIHEQGEAIKEGKAPQTWDEYYSLYEKAATFETDYGESKVSEVQDKFKALTEYEAAKKTGNPKLAEIVNLGLAFDNESGKIDSTFISDSMTTLLTNAAKSLQLEDWINYRTNTLGMSEKQAQEEVGKIKGQATGGKYLDAEAYKNELFNSKYITADMVGALIGGEKSRLSGLITQKNDNGETITLTRGALEGTIASLEKDKANEKNEAVAAEIQESIDSLTRYFEVFDRLDFFDQYDADLASAKSRAEKTGETFDELSFMADYITKYGELFGATPEPEQEKEPEQETAPDETPDNVTELGDASQQASEKVTEAAAEITTAANTVADALGLVGGGSATGVGAGGKPNLPALNAGGVPTEQVFGDEVEKKIDKNVEGDEVVNPVYHNETYYYGGGIGGGAWSTQWEDGQSLISRIAGFIHHP